MVRLIQVLSDEVFPRDPQALYIWAGSDGPDYGDLAAFDARPWNPPHFTTEVWIEAMMQGSARAHRSGIETVYLVRWSPEPTLYTIPPTRASSIAVGRAGAQTSAPPPGRRSGRRQSVRDRISSRP